MLVGLFACGVAVLAWWVPFLSDASRLSSAARELADFEGGNRAFLLTGVAPAALAAVGLGWALAGDWRGRAFGATCIVFVGLAFAEPIGLGIEVLRGGGGLGVDVGFAMAVPVLVLGLASLGLVIGSLRKSRGPGGSALVWSAAPGLLLVVVSRTWISSDSHVWSASAFVQLANWLELAVIAALVGVALVRGGFLGSSVALAVGLCGVLERIDFYFLVPSGDSDHSRPFAAVGIAGDALIVLAAAFSLASAAGAAASATVSATRHGTLLPPPRWEEPGDSVPGRV